MGSVRPITRIGATYSCQGSSREGDLCPAASRYFVTVDTVPLQWGLLCMIKPSPNMRLVRNGLGTFLVAVPAMVFIYIMLF